MTETWADDEMPPNAHLGKHGSPFRDEYRQAPTVFMWSSQANLSLWEGARHELSPAGETNVAKDMCSSLVEVARVHLLRLRIRR